MFELIFAVVVVFFAIFGLTETLHILKMFLLKPKKQPKRYLICEVDEGDKRKQILSVAENFRWYGKSIADCAVFLSDDFGEETKELINYLSKNEKIFFCDKAE